MRGSVGLVIGAVVGAGAMYLVLAKPWAGHATAQPVIDAGGVASAPADAAPKKKKPRRGGGGGGGGHPTAQVSDEGDEPVDLGPTTVVLTAADRAQETRGDDVALPKQKIDMGAGGEARSLDQGEIGGVIGGQSGPVQNCVVAGATNTDLRATIEVQLVVDGTGRVIKTRVAAPHYLFGKGLLTCIQGTARAMHFPATGAPTLVSFPINLG